MKFHKTLFLVTFIFLITFSLILYASEIEQAVEDHSFLSQFVNYESDDSNNVQDIKERRALEQLYITVLEKDPSYGYTFQEMNQQQQKVSLTEEPRLSVKFHLGSSQITGEGNEEIRANATIEQRGNSVRRADLKSFKIRLKENENIWSGQSILNLNKHPYDYTRVRNKLSFDYFDLIPGIISMNTQFVQLYVKDLTAANSLSRDFIDYGLFTHIEQPNKRFLRQNELDSDGYVYKAINFEFHRYPELLRERSDPYYDKEDFESVLSIKGREYHQDLLQMLDDVNNEELNFDGVFNKYFDRENFLTWIAVNILMGNLDTSGNNFYLYSSRYSDKWYLLPWDYDKAWDFDWQWGIDGSSIHPTREGLTLYWGWPLARRFFQDLDNLKDLNEKIELLTGIITEEQTKKFLDTYYPIVYPVITQLPDKQLIPEELDRFDTEYYSLVTIPTENRQKYYTNLEKPMPIFIGGPWINEDKMTFTWEESYDLQGNDIYYDLQISQTPDFETLYYKETIFEGTELNINLLPAGTFYWRIIIRDSEGNEQIPFESFVNESEKFFHGVKQFIIE